MSFPIDLVNKLKNLSFLVTGGCGFIGSHVAEYLLKNGAKYVRIIDNLSTGKMENIDEIILNKYGNVDFVLGDVSHYETCLKVTKNIDIICHQAALGSIPRSIDNPLNSHNSNVNGFINILEAARINGIKRIVYASSSSVYGDDDHFPKVEDYIGDQLSPYAVTKYINELYANIYTKLFKLECIGLRYFNVFGPRQNANGPYAAVIPKFIHLIKNDIQPVINGDGSYSRDFTYIDNVVQANLSAMLSNNSLCFGQVFNIGCGSRITILEIFNIITKLLNKNIKPIFGEIRKGDMPHTLADINKAKDLLGYSPIISIEKGLELLLM